MTTGSQNFRSNSHRDSSRSQKKNHSAISGSAAAEIVLTPKPMPTVHRDNPYRLRAVHAGCDRKKSMSEKIKSTAVQCRATEESEIASKLVAEKNAAHKAGASVFHIFRAKRYMKYIDRTPKATVISRATRKKIDGSAATAVLRRSREPYLKNKKPVRIAKKGRSTYARYGGE